MLPIPEPALQQAVHRAPVIAIARNFSAHAHPLAAIRIDARSPFDQSVVNQETSNKLMTNNFKFRT
jgi:hypothetical protein